MKIRFKTGSLLALALLMAETGALAASQEKAELFEDGVERAELLVVRITAPTTEGAGIIFHTDGKYAYGITARHVLFQQGKKVDDLKAHFQAWPHKQFPVEGDKFHHELDLAVFKADLSELNLSAADVLRKIPLDQLGSSEDLDPGALLHTMGHGTVGGWFSPKKEVKLGQMEGKNAFSSSWIVPRATPEAQSLMRTGGSLG